MLNVAIAVLSGLVWGVGDFAGGKATQRAAVLTVVWLSKLVSLPLLAIYLVATYVPISPIGLAWGGLAPTSHRASRAWASSAGHLMIRGHRRETAAEVDDRQAFRCNGQVRRSNVAHSSDEAG